MTTVRRTRRRWLKVAPYNPRSIPGAALQGEAEWRECARWVVMFGLDFAEAFDMSCDELRTLQALDAA